MPPSSQWQLLSGGQCRSALSSIAADWRLAAAVPVAALTAGGVACCCWRAVQSWRRSRRLDALRRSRQTSRAEAKARFGEYLAAQEPLPQSEMTTILAMPTSELVSRLRDKSLDPRRVLLAYQCRAYEIDRRLNCVVEFLHPDLDQVNLDGPLAGLPVSVKENMAMAGCYSCFGLATFAESAASEDCLPVRILRELGGIPFVRTGVPQTMMTVLSHNPIDGAVLNPVDETRSPGGSSSGEAALVAAGGSPLGLGTDIGGSIRLPAAWCGVPGFKPTSGRLTLQKFLGVGVQKLVTSSWGPIARDVETLAMFSASFFASEAQALLDPGVPPLGFDAGEAQSGGGDAKAQQRPLRIGFYTCDHQFQAVPSAERAVRETAEKLARIGHTLVPWDPQLKEFPLMETYYRAIGCDGAGTIDEALEADEVSYSVALGLHAVKIPWPGRKLRHLWCRLTGDAETSAWYAGSTPMPSVLAMWRFNQKVLEFRADFMRRWREDKLDVVICPAVGSPAVWIKPDGRFIDCTSYLVLYNLLNFPAGSVPVTKVTQADVDAVASGAYPSDRSVSHANVARMQASSVGLPVSVQCVALPWRDETCLRAMREVEAAAWSDEEKPR